MVLQWVSPSSHQHSRAPGSEIAQWWNCRKRTKEPMAPKFCGMVGAGNKCGWEASLDAGRVSRIALCSGNNCLRGLLTHSSVGRQRSWQTPVVIVENFIAGVPSGSKSAGTTPPTHGIGSEEVQRTTEPTDKEVKGLQSLPQRKWGWGLQGTLQRKCGGLQGSTEDCRAHCLHFASLCGHQSNWEGTRISHSRSRRFLWFYRRAWRNQILCSNF